MEETESENDYNRLMVVGEGLICLLQPFVWPHVYAPVLPATLTHFLDAPVPYIMGMRHQLASQAGARTPSTPRGSLASLQSFANFGLASETNVCYLDIDSGQVHSTDVDLPPFPNAVELQHNIEAILAVYQRHCRFSSPSSKNAAPQRSNANILPNSDSTEAPISPVPVIKRPQLDLNPPVMQRSASSRLIEQIAANSAEPEKPQLHHSATDSSFSSHMKTPEKPRCSEAYPSKEYFSSMHEIAANMTSKKELTEYSDLLKFNYAIRDVFINHLAEIFVDFETFVVLGSNSSENPEGSTAAAAAPTASSAHSNSGFQAFDKVGFLSDCPETHMAFLSPFLETQMFATFLDTNLTTLSANQVRRCSKCGLPPSSTSTTMSIQTSPSTMIVSAFLSRIRALKAQALAVEKPRRPATDRLSRKFLPHSMTHTPVVDSRVRRRDLTCAGIPKSPFDCIQYCKGPTPHPLFSKIKPTFVGLTASLQHGQFRLLDGSLLSKAPANRQCGSESPPQHPLPAVLGASVPSPLLSDAELIGPSNKEESPVLFRIGDGKISSKTVHCQYCSAPQTLPTTNLDQQTNQLVISRNIQMKGRDGLTRLLTGPAPTSLEPGSQSPSMAQAHWDIVDSLLEECKHRTMRMVIQKMGHEALHLGHNYQSVSEIEENTLVSGLCDLLERIWSHGLQKKHGASALWAHIQGFVKRNALESPQSVGLLPSRTPTHSPALPSRLPRSASTARTSGTSVALRKHDSLPRRSSTTTTASPMPIESSASTKSPLTVSRFRRALWTPSRSRSNTPAPIESSYTSGANDDSVVISVSNLLDIDGTSTTAFIDDVEAVKSVASSSTAAGGYKLRTNIGLARAFVRLALEKKRLSTHLKLLMSDSTLLRELYSRHAFLRCEEEREQFLIHLLSLNAVDYYSFTRMLQKAQMTYRVVVITGGMTGGTRSRLPLTSSANVWVCLRGHLGNSGHIHLSRASPTYVEFSHENLGILSTLLIGHDNAGFSPNMFVEAVIVITPLTNHTYLFPCGHWLGRGVEDNSCERLLIGQIAQVTKQGTVIIPRSMISPSVENEETSITATPVTRLYSDTALDFVTSTVLDRLANAVNRLAKHFACAGQAESFMSLSALLCGKEHGLAPALEAVFTHGIRSSGVFNRRRLYAWDFFERFVEHHTRIASNENQQSSRHIESDSTSMNIGGFDVSFATSPYFARTLPRQSTSGSGLRNLDSSGRRTPLLSRATPRLSLKSSALPPIQPPTASSSGWQSQPCSPGVALQRRQYYSSTRSIFALENFISTFQQVNRSGSQIGKLGKFQRMVCIGCRDHTIASWFPVLATSAPNLVKQMYDTRIPNFLIDPDLRDSVQTLLTTLNDFKFKLDPALLGSCSDAESSLTTTTSDSMCH
nr:RUN [Hymenolepis microstoma]